MENYECSPTGKLTYRDLLEHLKNFSDEQLDMDLSVEDPWQEECYEAELRFANDSHSVLDDWHPIIFLL